MSSITIDRVGFLANILHPAKGPCRVATTANITLEGTQTIDGVAVVADDRVLVKDQTIAKENAIYVAKTGEWELAQDFDTRGHVVRGTKVLVTEGTVNALTDWYVTTSGRPWPGREAIAFAQLFESGALAEHIADAIDAHDASAISVADAGGLYDATEVEAALAEVMGELNTDIANLAAHIADTTDAHDASAISVSPSGTLAADDVQEALVEILGDVETHVADSSAAHAASAVSFSATGGIAATDVQAAIAELDTEKQPLDAFLTDISDLSDPNADRILFFDDTAGGIVFLTVGSGLAITDTTLSASGSAAGIVLLASGTVAAAATLDIVLTAYTAYRAIKVLLSSFVPVTDDVELWMRFSTDGGSTYDAGVSDYHWALVGLHSNADAGNYSDNTSAQIVTAGDGTAAESVSNVADEGGADVEITLHDQTIARFGRVRISSAYHAADGNLVAQHGAGTRAAAQDTDAVQFLFESGNIASGKYAVYGYA